jgi:hypothetical protein
MRREGRQYCGQGNMRREGRQYCGQGNMRREGSTAVRAT